MRAMEITKKNKIAGRIYKFSLCKYAIFQNHNYLKNNFPIEHQLFMKNSSLHGILGGNL